MLKKLNFVAVLTALTIGLAVSKPAFAVDTTECFSKGAFTDFEGYYSFSYGTGGMGHGWNFLVGGGFTDTFSYSLSFEIANAGSSIEVGGLGLGFIITVVEMDKFAMDILPAFSFDANSSKGKLTYPNFEAFSGGADLEFNLMMIKAFQPFILAGFSGSYDAKTEEDSFEFPMAVGAMVPVKEGVEFLFQFGWTPTKDEVWNNVERTVAAGVNAGATENLEVITEIGWNFLSQELSLSLGLIYAL